MLASTTAMTTTSRREPDPPRQVRRHEPAEQWPDGGGDRGRGPDQGVGLLPGGAVEVAVDEGLHGGQQQRRAEAADDRPEDDDRRQALGQGHRRGADRVGEQPQDVRPLAADEVAHLAADQDERGGDQRLERDRGLDAAHGRVEVLDHRRDRDVHQRRVDDEHEHRRRQQQGQPRSVRILHGNGCARLVAHRTSKRSAAEQLLGLLPARSPGGRGRASPPAGGAGSAIQRSGPRTRRADARAECRPRGLVPTGRAGRALGPGRS